MARPPTLTGRDGDIWWEPRPPVWRLVCLWLAERLLRWTGMGFHWEAIRNDRLSHTKPYKRTGSWWWRRIDGIGIEYHSDDGWIGFVTESAADNFLAEQQARNALHQSLKPTEH